MRRLLAAVLAGSLLAACALIANLPDYEEKKATGPGQEGGPDSPVGPVPPVPPPPPVSPVVDAGPDAAFLGCDGPPNLRPVAYFRLDEGGGTVAHDCITGVQGNLSGTARWIAGRVGSNALAFDDAGGAVDFNTVPSFEITGALTVTAWAWVDDVIGAGRIVSKGGLSGDRGWELNVEEPNPPFFANGSLDFHIADGDGGEVRAAAANPPLHTWMHVAGVYEPGVAVRLYFNGNLAKEVTTTLPSQRNSTQPFAIGRRSANICCGLPGRVDDVRIFTRVLASSEIALLAR
jgi:hypothetical protein